MWIQKTRGSVSHLAYSLDGRFLYTLDSSEKLTAWDVASHTDTRIAEGLSLNPDTARGITPLTDNRLLVRTERFTVLDNAGKVRQKFNPSGLDPKGYAQIHNDGRVSFVKMEERRRTIVQCELGADSPKPVYTLPQSVDERAQISRFEWSHDEKSLVLLFTGYVVDGKVNQGQTCIVEQHDLIPVTDSWGTYRVKFSPDGRTLIVFSNSPEHFALWDVASRSMRVARVECSMPWGLFAFNPVYPLFAACQKDGTLAVWSLADGRPIQSLEFGLGKSLRFVAFSPDGLTCAVAGTNKQFAVFDVEV